MSRSASPARNAIASPSQLLSPDGVWYLYIVGPPPVASSVAFARTSRGAPVRMSSKSTPAAPEPSAAAISSTARWSSSRRTSRRQTCSASRLTISMPVRSPLCTVRSKVWPAKAFWWIVPSGLRSKKQPSSFSNSRMGTSACVRGSQARASAVGHLAAARLRLRAQQPGGVRGVQPLAAVDRVHEVALDRVARRERDVVAALHHAGAAAFPEQPLDRDRDIELGRRPLRMQGREQPGAAGAENEDVGREGGERSAHAAS